MERLLRETLLRPLMNWPKMGIVKARKFSKVKSIFVFLNSAGLWEMFYEPLSSHAGSLAGRAFSLFV